MTEDEAKTKWCPFVRLGHPGNRVRPGMGLDFNTIAREGMNLPDLKCLASDCMAWRWNRARSYSMTETPDEMTRTKNGDQWIVRPVAPDGDGWRPVWRFNKKDAHGAPDSRPHPGMTEWVKHANTDGFCGLAGAPQ